MSIRVSKILPVLSKFNVLLSSTTEHQPTLVRYHVPHNVSHHIDYITPGIKLMTGGHDENITKRMIGRRSLPVTGDFHGKGGEGGDESWNGRGKGKKKCKPRPDPSLPVHPGKIESQFLVTGPCSDEITPHCIRGKFILYMDHGFGRDANRSAAQYQIPNGTKAAKGNELGIFQGLGQHYNQGDLDRYWKHIAP
jgi:tripeptidyl-peptidase-1